MSVKFGLKAVGAFLALWLVLMVLLSLITTGTVFFEAGVAKITAAPRVTKKVYETDNIIGQVAAFEQLCSDVSSDYSQWRVNQANFERTEKEIKEGVIQDPTGDTLSQVQTQAQGPLNALIRDSNDYNAKSRNYTQAPFRSAGLPYQITPPQSEADLVNWSPPSCGTAK